MVAKSTFMKLKENEREVRRSLIMDAAKALFAERPFHEIGMRDIAAEAGIAAGSIYRYFPSRDDLLMEALIHEVKASEQKIKSRLDEGMVTIEDFATGVINHLLDNEIVVQMMAHFNVRGEVDQDSLERFNTAQRSLFAMFDKALTDGGAVVEGDIRFFSHAFFASLIGIVMTFHNYPGRKNEEIRKHMERLALITATVFKKGMV